MTLALGSNLSEADFALRVEELAADPSRQAELLDLLAEEHPVYGERSAAAISRMRGWALISLARNSLPDAGLIYAIEELDTGRDPYLVAAAAQALRSRPHPSPAVVPYLVRAIGNIRNHDDLVSFESYGVYADGENGTTALSELLATLRCHGGAAAAVVGDLEVLTDELRRGGSGSETIAELTEIIATIRDAGQAPTDAHADCCPVPWARWKCPTDSTVRDPSAALEAIVLEDQNGRRAQFGELFRGKPSIVVFFYTRCDNPWKCSLTVAKLGAVQRLLVERGLGGQVRTAAISYDPGWDTPERIRGYAVSRRVHLDDDNRMLRTTDEGFAAIRAHLGLGVNYIESLVNRHRVEVFVLDRAGQVAATFARLQWDEHEVTDRVAAVLAETTPVRPAPGPRSEVRVPRRLTAGVALGPLGAVAMALVPKCPVCLAAYLSALGIAGLERLADLPWLTPALVALMGVNLASLWWRGGARQPTLAFHLGAAGAVTVLVLGVHLDLAWARTFGVVLTVAGSLVSVANRRRRSIERLPAGATRLACRRVE